MGAGEAMRLVIKNFLANHIRALWPDRWIDRRGRCVGNWRALFDVATGRDYPANILNFG